MIFDPTVLSDYALIAAGFGAAFIAALWLSLIIWAFRDIRSRTKDALMRVLAVLVVVVLFLPGALVYLIMRPPRTLEEEYQHSLEEEALLQSLEDIPLCPGCGRRTAAEWVVCPHCQTRLKKRCHQCNQIMELPWNLCPYCATPAPGMRREADSDDTFTSTAPVDSEISAP
jgi:hypothetical protein